MTAPVHERPEPPARSTRATQIVAAASDILESEGAEALTMRRLAAELDMQAPSLYKHFPNKAAVEHALIENALFDVGDAMHAAVARPGRQGSVVALLRVYREFGLAQPNTYRLTTGRASFRTDVTPGLEEWSGEPFYLATGAAYLAQALWAFAHGMVILEVDGRFLEGSDLDRTWTTAARAFTGARHHPRR